MVRLQAGMGELLPYPTEGKFQFRTWDWVFRTFASVMPITMVSESCPRESPCSRT